jgi:hypothetical protein
MLKAARCRRHAGGAQRLAQRELVATRRAGIAAMVGAAGVARDLGGKHGREQVADAWAKATRVNGYLKGQFGLVGR